MISLTFAGRAVAAVAMLAGLAIAAGQLGWSTQRLARSQAAQGGVGVKIARRLIVYRLDPGRSTTFRFTQPVRQARLISQPILAAGNARKGESWTYAVYAELLDGEGQIVARHEIHSRAGLFAADGHRRGPLRFYRGSSEQVASPDEVRLGSARPFHAIRLTAAAGDPALVAIDVRVSERRPLLTSAAGSAFGRYSADDQARLSAPNAFPLELLTAGERSNIAINQWRPVGPTGIDGRDYRMRVLYEEAGVNDDGDDLRDLRSDPEDGE